MVSEAGSDATPDGEPDFDALVADHPELARLGDRPSSSDVASVAAREVADAFGDTVRRLIHDGIEPLIKLSGGDRAGVYRAYAKLLRRWAETLDGIASSGGRPVRKDVPPT